MCVLTVSALDVQLSAFTSTPHPTPPVKELWDDLQKPYPTGAWWLNYVLPADAPYPAVAYPYAVKVQADGLTASYSATRRRVKPKEFADVFAPGTQ